MKILIVYALQNRQVLREMNVPEGMTLEAAVRQCGLPDEFQEIDPEQSRFGIFGRVVPRSTELREGDRVEIYRPLLIDPKAARQRRALKR